MADAGAFTFIRFGEIKAKEPDWLVRGLLERNALASLYGDPGCYKTFLAIDWAFRLGCGLDFHGHTVTQAPVAYIAAEGRNGLARRRLAWEIRNGITIADKPIFLSSSGAHLYDENNAAAVARAVDAIAREHGAPGLIVVDTLARNFGPGDENHTSDMTQFIRSLDVLRTAHEATVLLVHHTGHGDKSRARGASALRAALDAEYQLERDEQGTVRLHGMKMKDAPEPESMAFRVATVELGFDDDEGDPVTSAVLNPTDYTPPAKAKKATGKNQQKALAALQELYDTARANLEGSDRAPRIEVEHWRQACMDESGLTRQRFNEAKGALQSKGLIVIEPPFVRLEETT
jgi:hypothetical protein